MIETKNHYIAWVCDSEILDGCALQGPHTYTKAIEIKNDLHKMEIKASVIYSSSLDKLIKSKSKE